MLVDSRGRSAGLTRVRSDGDNLADLRIGSARIQDQSSAARICTQAKANADRQAIMPIDIQVGSDNNPRLATSIDNEITMALRCQRLRLAGDDDLVLE